MEAMITGMIIKLGEWYHIVPDRDYHPPDSSSFNLLAEGDYRIVNIRTVQISVGQTTYLVEVFQVEGCPARFPIPAHKLTHIGREHPLQSKVWSNPKEYLTPEDLVAMYSFAKRASLTLPEVLFLFEADNLFYWPNTSNKSKQLFVDLEAAKKKRDSSTDLMDKKIYTLIIELFDILLIDSLHHDYYFVPEILYPEISGKKK